MIAARRLAIGALVLGPVSAQAQGMHDMPGMAMPMPAAKPAAPAPKPAKRKGAPAPHKHVAKPAAKTSAPAPATTHHHEPGMDLSGMDMSGADTASPAAAGEHAHGADHAGTPAMDGTAMPGMGQSGTALPAGNAMPPPPPRDHYADRFFPPESMARAHHAMMRESGGLRYGTVLFNLAEVQVHRGQASYRWDGEGWYGGDIHRVVVKTEGEGSGRGGVEGAEVQALYSRAIGPYFDLQAGIRHDFAPSPARTYATIGIEGLAPYMFEVGAAAFVSPQGDVLGRLEGYYDQRITQRLVLQPRIELNLAAQDMPAQRIGAGLTDAELGLRLRYEIARRLAPYIGISWQAKAGRTGDFARADGNETASTTFVAGVRFGF